LCSDYYGELTVLHITKNYLQARHGNMADVAAKDGSQETLVNLAANNIGIFLLPLITKDK